jgi:hypothetical protein
MELTAVCLIFFDRAASGDSEPLDASAVQLAFWRPPHTIMRFLTFFHKQNKHKSLCAEE